MEQKILVVDDEKEIRDLLSEILTKEGYAVVTAASGGEAIEKFSLEKPQLAIIDFKLPDMSGVEVLRKIKDAQGDAKVVMLSGYAREESIVVAEVKDWGAADFLIKPVDRKTLLEKIEKVLKG